MDMDEPELKRVMHAVADSVINTLKEHTADEHVLFTALIFNDPRTTQYISNCHRNDMMKAMRETLQRMEAKEDFGEFEEQE